jgi:ABC-type glutathione transport system ATPase component
VVRFLGGKINMENSLNHVLEVESLRVTHYVRRSSARRIPLHAVDGVDMHVKSGEIVGLVGESGSGKSSLSLAVAALGKVTSGKIQVSGQELTLLRGKSLRRARADVQMVFQDPHASLDPRQSIGSGLNEIRKLHADRVSKLTNEELLLRVGLSPGILDRVPSQISGGQAQRVSITRAMMLQPALLIADEPTSGLDASVQAQIVDLFRTLRVGNGLSILFVSHNLAVVRQLCDRAYVMKEGVVVESGDTKTIFESPQHSYTRSLIDAVPGKNLKLAESGL